MLVSLQDTPVFADRTAAAVTELTHWSCTKGFFLRSPMEHTPWLSLPRSAAMPREVPEVMCVGGK